MPIWEGHDLAPAHGHWRFWVAQGRDELPEFRTSSQLIPFRRGRLHQAGTADARDLEVRGYVKETTDPAMRAELDLLKGLLDPGTEEPGRLIDTFEDGGQRWIDAIPRNVISRYGGKATRLLSIALEALDPYWYGSNGVITLDTGLYLDAGLLLDMDAKVVIDPTSTTHGATFTALGTADVENVVVEVVGPSVGAIDISNLSVVTNGSSSGFSHPKLLAGQTLVVDSGGRSARIGGANARGQLTLHPGNRHGEYFRIRPGTNSLSIIGWPAEVRLSFMAVYL